MFKFKKTVIFQALGLVLFCVLAMASSSQKSSSSSSYSDIDWRGAAVGGTAGYNGYSYIGTASSESDARSLTANKGYSQYIWDSVNGKVYAK